MGNLRDDSCREAERWIQAYPQWKKNLPRSRDLFNYHEFDRIERIEQVLRELGEEERKLLEMIQQGKSYVAISMALHMSEATVWRAKVRLMKKLSEGFGIVPPATEERATI